jgi:hypothetical protein
MKRVRTLGALFLFSSFVAFAQHTDAATETDADVPVLHQFHTVIYKLWHTAWPNKDIALLTSLVPEIEQRSDAVVQAKLPGILRDKQTAWQAHVKRLQEIVQLYKSAATAKNENALLDAAELLHSHYEKLVRLIRPPLPEIDEFHTALYPLYHYYLPEYNLDKIKSSAEALAEKMSVLNRATLPERMKNKEANFTAKRASLSNAVSFLQLALATEKKETIKAAIEHVHTDYQSLEKVFE